MKKGKILAVNISETKGVVKKPIEVGYFRQDWGLDGDAHAGHWHRQVSLLAQESVDIMKAQGISGLCVGKFAENLTTQGIELHTLPVGTKFKIGDTIQQLTQIGKECHVGCAIMQQVGKCIMPTHGIFTKVLVGGDVKAGDDIIVMED